MDRRLTPTNGRVAHSSLEGQVAADRFVAGELRRLTVPAADLCDRPDGRRDKQLLFGRSFTALETRDGWVFGFDTVDGYCGYLREPTLGPDFTPTHRLRTRWSHIYSAPDIKAPERHGLSFFSELDIIGQEGAFSALAGGGYVPTAHLAPISWVAHDAADIALSFLGTPYLWGGNSGTGIDCSGLVQLALWAAGRACPRDSDMQQALGEVLPEDGPLRRGDLLFWKGHVAMALGNEALVHANAHHMAVVCEQVTDAVARIASQGGGRVTARRRP